MIYPPRECDPRLHAPWNYGARWCFRSVARSNYKGCCVPATLEGAGPCAGEGGSGYLHALKGHRQLGTSCVLLAKSLDALLGNYVIAEIVKGWPR